MRMGEGVVKKIEKNNMIKIEVCEDSLYEAKQMFDSYGSVYVHAKNTLGAQKGDKVRYEMEDRHQNYAAFITFGLPLLLMLASGFILGAILDNSTYGTIAGILGLLVGIGIVKAYDSHLSKTMNTEPHLLEIVAKDEEPAEKRRKFTEHAAMNVLQKEM